MAAENYSDVVQALAKQIVDTCMKLIRQNLQSLIAGVTIDSSQITGDIVATTVVSDVSVSAGNVSGLNDYVADMIRGSSIDVSQIASVGEDGRLYLRDVYVDTAHISDLEAQFAELWRAQIDVAEIRSALIESLRANLAEIARAEIGTASIDVAQITTLNAVTAEIANLLTQNATIGYAQIEGLTAGQALISEVVGGKVYIADLAVTEANMVNLTVGQLVVKGQDGNYYQLTVSADEHGDPTVVATEMMSITGANIAEGAVTGDNIAAATIDGSTKIIENSITAKELNVQNIFAQNANVLSLIAKNINVSDLFANTAFINQLNAADISGNSYLQLAVSEAVDQAEDNIMSEVELRLTDESIISTVTGSTAFQDSIREAAAPVLKIDSSRGTVFKSNSVNTVLTVTIFHGSVTITNRTQLTAEFGASSYLRWQYLPYGSEPTDGWREMLSTDSHISNDGFTLTLTPEDVDTKVTFRCLLEEQSTT